MRIHDIATAAGDSGYYDQGFLNTINDHLTYLKKLPRNRVHTLTYQIADKYNGDFFGLLDHLQIPKKYHYSIMLINDLLSSSDYGMDKITLIIPDTSEIELIKSIYDTRQMV